MVCLQMVMCPHLSGPHIRVCVCVSVGLTLGGFHTSPVAV